MVKNKALPDPARPYCTPSLVTLFLSLSLPPSQTWPYQGWSHVSLLSLTSFIQRVPPGSCRGWTQTPGIYKTETLTPCVKSLIEQYDNKIHHLSKYYYVPGPQDIFSFSQHNPAVRCHNISTLHLGELGNLNNRLLEFIYCFQESSCLNHQLASIFDNSFFLLFKELRVSYRE